MRLIPVLLAASIFLVSGCQKESTSSADSTDMMVQIEDTGGGSVADAGSPPADMSSTDNDGGDTTLKCDGEHITDLNAAATVDEDGVFTLDDRPSGRSDFVGSCGGNGNERGYRFTAPEAGTWSFTLSSDVDGLDTVMYARTDCLDTESEIACNDDRVRNQVLLSRVNLELEADQTVYVYADVFSGSGDAFAIEARLTPVVALDEVCDGAGESVVCPTGAFCRVDPNGDSSDGVCAPNGPAVINEVLAYRNGNELSLQINGEDTGADVVTGRLQLYQGDQRIILDASRNADTFIMNPIEPVFGQTTFAYRYRADVFENWPETTAVKVMLVDSQENQGEWVTVDIGEAPPASGDTCDQYRIMDRCLNGTACLDPDDDGQFSCVVVTAPTIRTVKGYYDVETLLIGFEVDGQDPDEDVSLLYLELLDAEGEGVASGTIPFQTVQNDEGAYAAQVSFRLAQDFMFTAVRISVIDAEGLQSETRDLPGMRPPRSAAAGDNCDPLGARANCEDDLYCYPAVEGDAPICGEPVSTCPMEWGEITTLEGNGREWRAAGDLSTRPNVTSGSCGGGSGQAIYEFTAPNAGTYSFVANSMAGGSDPVIYARSHCQFGGDYPDFELGCSDDHSRYTRAGLVRVEMAAGQTIFVFVDGARGDSGAWRGPYTLVGRKLP
jgi:hypothetical protein